MRDITHTDLELLYQLADGINGEGLRPLVWCNAC